MTPRQGTGEGFSVARLRAARKAVGITQQRLAELLEVSVSVVQDWEQGKYEPRSLFRKAVMQFIEAAEAPDEEAPSS